MAQQRPLAWIPLVGALLVGVTLAGLAGWWVNLRSIEDQIQETRAALKKSRLSGGIPPNQEVLEYLTSRQSALQQREQHWLELIAAPPLAEAASADPQLYFQERVHELQRTLERLAAARTMPVPEQLGFPKELPPVDTVARLLVQLSLIQEAAELILEQGVNALASLKIDDPEAVPAEEGGEPFLTRLPVRVRLTSSLPDLMKVLGALERVHPLIDVRAIRVLGGGASGPLEVELLLARYLVLAASPESAATDAIERSTSTPSSARAASPSRRPRRAQASASKKNDEE